MLYRDRRTFNRQLGCAAYEVIWSIVGQSPAGCIWLIDAWFGFQPRDTLQQLLQHAGVEKVLEVWNHISPELAVSALASRLQDRKPGHPGEEYLPELAQLAQQAEPNAAGAGVHRGSAQTAGMSPLPVGRNTNSVSP